MSDEIVTKVKDVWNTLILWDDLQNKASEIGAEVKLHRGKAYQADQKARPHAPKSGFVVTFFRGKVKRHFTDLAKLQEFIRGYTTALEEVRSETNTVSG